MACPRRNPCRLLGPAAEPSAFVTAATIGGSWFASMLVEVYAKKTRKIPQEIIDRCQKRLKDYDEAVKKAPKEPPMNQA